MSIHLKELKHGDLGEATIIVGDPGRVSLLAEAFDKRSIIDDIEPGDIILNTGMARTTGLMTTYVPDTYPAVADSLLVSRIAKHLSGSKKIHIGLGLTAETYYIGQGRGISIKGKALPVPNMIEEWSSLGIMNCEMETAVLYILASLYQIPAANCLAVHVSRKNEKWECEEDYRKLHYEMAQLVLDAMLEPSTQYEKEKEA